MNLTLQEPLGEVAVHALVCTAHSPMLSYHGDMDPKTAYIMVHRKGLLV